MSKSKFKSDEEFANWVESAEGKDLIHKQYDEARKKGKLRPEVPAKVAAILSSKVESKNAVSIHLRVPAKDLDKARSIAERKGIGYQTWIKMAIHEAVERENR